MKFSKLNPLVRSVGIYEFIGRAEECRAYDCRLIYMISGDVAVNIEDEKKFHLSVGNLLFIPAGTKYKLKGQYLRAAIITFDLTAEHSDLTERIPPALPSEFKEDNCHKADIVPFDRVLRLEDMESERDSFIKMNNIATSAEGAWRDEVSAMLKLILLKLAETVSDDALPARMVEALDTYIRENCSDEISNTEIGAIFGYHPFYVSRVLKEKKGITLRQYIIAYRLKAAKRMLELTKMSIAEIAEETGFTDASYFTKTFRQTFGMTPKEWRNKFKEEFI
jgi:AraC-like DNA-binding protein